MVGAVTLQFLNGTVHVKPGWTGKTATALQMIAIGCIMFQMDLFQTTLTLGSWKADVHFLDIPVWLAGLFTAISGFGCIVEGIHQLHSKGHGDPKTFHEN